MPSQYYIEYTILAHRALKLKMVALETNIRNNKHNEVASIQQRNGKQADRTTIKY
jgi:hypothetical protein